MATRVDSLMAVYEGWDGYHRSIALAVSPLTREQLAWRPAAHHRSVGELLRHLCMGRITWFARMGAPGSIALANQIRDWAYDTDGNRYIAEAAIDIAEHTSELLRWLEATWQMIDQTLTTWDVSDLGKTYQHVWNGETYTVSRQWTIWRIMAHDIHHGGELSLMLGLQGIDAFELIGLGGHTVLPPLAEV